MTHRGRYAAIIAKRVFVYNDTHVTMEDSNVTTKYALQVLIAFFATVLLSYSSGSTTSFQF